MYLWEPTFQPTTPCPLSPYLKWKKLRNTDSSLPQCFNPLPFSRMVALRKVGEGEIRETARGRTALSQSWLSESSAFPDCMIGPASKVRLTCLWWPWDKGFLERLSWNCFDTWHTPQPEKSPQLFCSVSEWPASSKVNRVITQKRPADILKFAYPR